MKYEILVSLDLAGNNFFQLFVGRGELYSENVL